MRLFVLFAVGALAMGAAAGQEIQRITADGERQMLAGTGRMTVGAHLPDVTVVEYFDYNCPYCKKMVPTLNSLVAQDHKLAVIYKEWPILGELSVYAARSTLAAMWQGKYLAAHDALMSGPRLSTHEQIDALLQLAGVNMAALNAARAKHAADINALLSRSEEEASALGLKGTPGLIVGRQLLPGIADLTQLQQLVEASRSAK